MKFNSDKHHRKSIRLKGYDYTQPGWYFITICTQNREWLLGEITGGEMVLNTFGGIVRDEWLNTEKIRDNVELDAFVVMPNHFHGIIHIAGAYGETPLLQNPQQQTFKSPSHSIGAIIRGFKSAVTKQINQMRNKSGLRVWQRNYWEHVVRNENDLNRIREYIRNNPLKWQDDQYFK
jgi:putative transposase